MSRTKIVWISIAAFVGVIVFGVGMLFLTGSIQKWTADFRGGVEQTEMTQADGSYRIAAYDMFFDRCAAIQADEDRIKNIEEGGAAQKDVTLTALKNSRAEKIREYNADAAKEDTRGAFRDSGLPYEISVEGNDTTCHVN